MVAPKEEEKANTEIEIPVFVQSPGVENKTVAVEKDNLVVIDELGTTIPPISTKYDYDEPYSFKSKGKADSGNF